MGQGIAAQRMEHLGWTPGAEPSAALVNQVLSANQSEQQGRSGRLNQMLLPAAMGLATGLGAGLLVKAAVATGVAGVSLLMTPATIYVLATACTALLTSLTPVLPRLREFSFLSAIASAAVMLS